MKVPMRFKTAWWETEGELAWLTSEGVAGVCWVPTYYKVNTDTKIMMCYPMGDNARTLTAIGDAAGGGEAGDKAIIDAILKDLDITFPQAPNQATANYIDGLVQNWGNSTYTRGAYSFPKVGTYISETDTKRKDLQTPVANNRIFFAGVATHVTHSATVVGALHSGERAAKSVQFHYGNRSNSTVS